MLQLQLVAYIKILSAEEMFLVTHRIWQCHERTVYIIVHCEVIHTNVRFVLLILETFAHFPMHHLSGIGVLQLPWYSFTTPLQ
jgi:hypothetical protein